MLQALLRIAKTHEDMIDEGQSEKDQIARLQKMLRVTEWSRSEHELMVDAESPSLFSPDDAELCKTPPDT